MSFLFFLCLTTRRVMVWTSRLTSGVALLDTIWHDVYRRDGESVSDRT
ncbi:MAG TPA: hypothetical protein VJ672_04580 [Gemmatimonadaceae bacterium]|nr:hypothetical protein [Gemmatimonadaceae bacterium]